MDSGQTYWNGPGGTKTFTTPFPTREFLDALGNDGGRVLDFGCGHGRILAELLETEHSGCERSSSERSGSERPEADSPTPEQSNSRLPNSRWPNSRWPKTKRVSSEVRCAEACGTSSRGLGSNEAHECKSIPQHPVREPKEAPNSACGSGRHQVIGLDFSMPLLHRARQNAPEALLAVSDHRNLPIPDASVSGVVLLAVLTCMPDDADQEALLAEIHRVLRPGGILAVNDFLLNTDQRNLDRYANGEREHGTYGVFRLMDGGVCRHFAESRVRTMLTDFQTREYRPTVFTTMHGNRSNGFFWLGSKAK